MSIDTIDGLIARRGTGTAYDQLCNERRISDALAAKLEAAKKRVGRLVTHTCGDAYVECESLIFCDQCVYNDGTKAKPICADPVEWVDGGSGDEVCRYRDGAVRKSDLDAKDKRIADLTAKLEAATEANARIVRGQFAQICSACGYEVPAGESSWETLQSHIETCEKHPVFKLTAENKRLQEYYERLAETTCICGHHKANHFFNRVCMKCKCTQFKSVMKHQKPTEPEESE